MTRAKLSVLTAAIVLVLAVALASVAGYFSLGLLAAALVWLGVALYQYLKGAAEVSEPTARLRRRVSRIVLFWT